MINLVNSIDTSRSEIALFFGMLQKGEELGGLTIDAASCKALGLVLVRAGALLDELRPHAEQLDDLQENILRQMTHRPAPAGNVVALHPRPTTSNASPSCDHDGAA